MGNGLGGSGRTDRQVPHSRGRKMERQWAVWAGVKSDQEGPAGPPGCLAGELALGQWCWLAASLGEVVTDVFQGLLVVDACEVRTHLCSNRYQHDQSFWVDRKSPESGLTVGLGFTHHYLRGFTSPPRTEATIPLFLETHK